MRAGNGENGAFVSDGALHPVAVEISPEEIRREFTKVALTGVVESAWHVETAVHKTSRVGPAGKEAPVPGGPMVSLALLNRPEPAADMEVFGQNLVREVDPADWLDLWLEQQGFAVLSRKRVGMLGGAVGDVVARWEAGGGAWMGRFFCMKAGPRLALVWFRTAEGDYEKLAGSFFLAIAHFRFLEDRFGPLVEPVKWVGSSVPTGWRTAIPVSWKVMEEPATAVAGSFQATLMEEGGGVMLGKLSFTVVAAGAMGEAREGFEKMYSALRDAGVVFEAAGAVEERGAEGFAGAWFSQFPATVNGVRAEVRCRGLKHAKCWVAGLVMMPVRGDSPQLWMQGKRVLDIATMTLEIA